MAIPMIAGMLASYAIKAGIGAIQGSSKKPDEIDYEIPSEVLQALNIAKRSAYGEAPRFRTMRENLESRGAATAGRMRDIGGAAAMGGVADVQANVDAGTREIDVLEEEFRHQAEGRYLGQLENVAQYRDKEFEYDVADPNERAWNEYYNRKSAGAQNMWSAFSGGMSALTEMENNRRIDERLNKYLGIGGTDDDFSDEEFQFNDDIMSEDIDPGDFGAGNILGFKEDDPSLLWGDTFKGI